MIIKLNATFEVLFQLDYLERLWESYPIIPWKDKEPVLRTMNWRFYGGTYQPTGIFAISHNLADSEPYFVKYAETFFEDLLGSKPPKEKIQLIRTQGSIVPHRDIGHGCRINVGLINSDKAITRFHLKDDGTDAAFSTFKEQQNQNDVRCEPGSAYLLDNNIMHEVFSDTTEPRYLVTCLIKDPFDITLSRVNPARLPLPSRTNS